MTREMGKFGDKKKRKLADEDREDDDPELDSEIAAVLAMRAEKEGKRLKLARKGARDAAEESDSQENDDDDDLYDNQSQHTARQVGSKSARIYDRDGLLDSSEGLGAASLPFIESMQVCEFEAGIQDEHDDLQREVR